MTEDECKCSCHKVQQINERVIIGKMIFCDCQFPHDDPVLCKLCKKRDKNK